MYTLTDNEKNKKTSQLVIEHIQTMIMDGTLKAGDRLPPERELTEAFEIGRPALREALRALEVLGLIERRHGLGNYITNDVGNNFFKPLSLSFKLANRNINEILELRYAIEIYSVRQAAKKATADDVKRLYSIHEEMLTAETSEKKAEYDWKLHFEIANICNNSLIINTFENASYLFNHFIDQTVRMSNFPKDSIERIYEEHLNIINAIENGDGELAAACLNRHLGNIDPALLHEI